jgi:hypothetical protein
MRSFKFCTHHTIGSSNEEPDGRSMWHVWETGEVHAGYWWVDLNERDHLEDLGIDGMIILE